MTSHFRALLDDNIKSGGSCTTITSFTLYTWLITLLKRKKYSKGRKVQPKTILSSQRCEEFKTKKTTTESYELCDQHCKKKGESVHYLFVTDETFTACHVLWKYSLWRYWMQIDKFQVYIIRKPITKNGMICDVKEAVIIYMLYQFCSDKKFSMSTCSRKYLPVYLIP